MPSKQRKRTKLDGLLKQRYRLDKKTYEAIKKGLRDVRAERTISWSQMKKDDKDNAKGKKYDGGKPPLDLLSRTALIELAKVMDYGKFKYDAHNWRKGIHWSRVLAAALRHIYAFNDGETLDPETGISHIAHAMACCMFLLEYQKTRPDLDDRYKRLK